LKALVLLSLIASLTHSLTQSLLSHYSVTTHTVTQSLSHSLISWCNADDSVSRFPSYWTTVCSAHCKALLYTMHSLTHSLTLNNPLRLHGSSHLHAKSKKLLTLSLNK
jgi:hypothetical protein